MRTPRRRESGGKERSGDGGRPARSRAAAQANGFGSPKEPGSEAATRDALPHRARMERAFGLSFADVEARTGAGAALDPIGADAARSGRQVQFRESEPGPAQVAHELTHVLQERRAGSTAATSRPEIAAADSAAEREAERNAVRIGLGLAPRMPRERAAPGAIHRDVKTDLRKAMAGWGTDEDSIYKTLDEASEDEKAAVRSDPTLMAELQDELTRGEWVKVLNKLSLGIETQIHAAGEGWGTDEQGIYRAVENADAAGIKELLGNGALLLYLRDELTNGELGRVIGTAADTLELDLASTPEDVFHTLMLFPGAVKKACDYFEAQYGSESLYYLVIAQLPAGSAMTAATVADADIHIANDGNKDRIMRTLRRRWDFDSGKVEKLNNYTKTSGTDDWSIWMIRQVHKTLKQVPPDHVTQKTSDIDFVGVDPALKGTTTGGYWSGSNNTIGLQQSATGLSSTVRHEVGHAVDGLLGNTSENWKKGRPNFWNWGSTIRVWEDRMPDAWKQRDGNLVPVADRQPIREIIQNYAKTTDGKGNLKAHAKAASPTHKILDYWGKGVPLIQAAKSLAGRGKTIYSTKSAMKKYGSDRFTWIPDRREAFLVFDDFVWREVHNNYALYNHPEFFAVLYEKYYEDGSGDERLSKLAEATWQAFFDNHVHGAR